MSSRESILAAIKINKPSEVPLPDIDLEIPAGDAVEKFIATLTGIGGKCIMVSDHLAIEEMIEQQQQEGKFVIQAIPGIKGYNASGYAKADASSLDTLETTFIKGTVSVAENGSIWIPETNMVNRLLPFICQHLVVLIDIKDMVPTMHQAYDIIKVDNDGYGAFIAGPSKTADIEQSLVIGAHGPLSLTVFLLNN